MLSKIGTKPSISKTGTKPSMFHLYGATSRALVGHEDGLVWRHLFRKSDIDPKNRSQTPQASPRGGIGMETVEKTRCYTASLRAGARISNPERVGNTELLVGV